ncbi:MAG: hypothetical protein FWF56_03625 [Firmicutes bacterium]|nr:hypothetical protein [Bacillota bacterium]
MQDKNKDKMLLVYCPIHEQFEKAVVSHECEHCLVLSLCGRIDTSVVKQDCVGVSDD